MDKKKIFLNLTIFLFIFCLLFPGEADAYLDPGTGSYIIQLVIAGLLGVSFTIKLYWKRIRGFIFRLFLKQKDGSDSEQKNTSELL